MNAVSVIFSKLVPFRALADDADAVVVQPGQLLPLPTFKVSFGKFTPEVPAIPGTPAVPQKSGPNRPDYQPAIPATPDTPAVPANFTEHRSEMLTLTQDEWDNWEKGVSDNEYILSIVAKRYGQTLIAAQK